jgi:hypothetical protein
MISEPLDGGRETPAPLTYEPAAAKTQSSTVRVVLAWTVVAIPALWGISMTVRTAAKLFHPTQGQAMSAPAQPSGVAK